MHTGEENGHIIILNGVPRSGKSSIASQIQESFEGVWMNLGVDGFMKMTPEKYQPSIGLRPGGERADLEPVIVALYEAMYESIVAHSRIGINVVADTGHHDSYSVPRNILHRCLSRLAGFPVTIVGVKCPLDEIMKRRSQTQYKSYTDDGEIPKPILLWQEAVHSPGIYDLEIDTSILSPEECAEIIKEYIANPAKETALQRIIAEEPTFVAASNKK